MAQGPLILFGAFDRHNFGDLLFPHLAAALLPGRRLIHAGLAERDLRVYGGHRVRALTGVLGALEPGGADLMHVGGELLDCTAWEAAVMLQSHERAAEVVAALDRDPVARTAWAQRELGCEALAPYVVGKARSPGLRRVVFNAVGGVALGTAEAAMQREVAVALTHADALSVRDEASREALAALGVAAELCPDPAVLVARCCAQPIARHADRRALTELAARFPQGYLALQFSADFGDDASLDRMARALADFLCERHLGIVLFRAGAAPWHDDADVCRRLVARLPPGACLLFASLHLWDICALLAGATMYVGSSLHGRIVATAFGRPRLSLVPPGHTASRKLEAYLASWEIPGLPTCAALDALAPALAAAAAADPASLRAWAARLEQDFLARFAGLRAALG